MAKNHAPLTLLKSYKKLFTCAVILVIISGLLLFWVMPISSASVLDDFTGEYCRGSDFTSECLIIKPDHTFELAYRGDAGDSYVYNGAITIAPGEFILKSADKEVPDRNLTLVKWGNRRYMFDTDLLPLFCEEINQYISPRPWHIFIQIRLSYFYRTGDKYKSEFGYPISLQGERICP